MEISTTMTQAELEKLNYTVQGFNARLKEEQKVVSKNQLEEADFLKLMITQLKTQDPTKPLDDKEFIGQMAQFTTMKQMNELGQTMKNIGKEFAFTKALSMVNREVIWADETGALYSGIVNSIKVINGETVLNIEGNEINLNQISEVK